MLQSTFAADSGKYYEISFMLGKESIEELVFSIKNSSYHL